MFKVPQGMSLAGNAAAASSFSADPVAAYTAAAASLFLLPLLLVRIKCVLLV